MLAAIEGYSTDFETSLNELLNNYEVEHIFPISPSQETEKEYSRIVAMSFCEPRS